MTSQLSMTTTERAVLAIAGLLAMAIWLPLPLSEDRQTKQRDLAFVVSGDPKVAMSNFADRPLLAQSRRPPTGLNDKAAAPATPALPISERFSLRGLAQMGNVDVAIVLDTSSNRFHRLQRGQAIGDWYLSEVNDQKAILKNAAGAEHTLSMIVK